MKRTLTLVIMVLVALASGFAAHAAAGTPNRVGLAGQVAAADVLPFKGTLEGRHISRTPLAPPFVFDRFETEGQATQLDGALDRRRLTTPASTGLGLPRGPAGSRSTTNTREASQVSPN